MFLKRDKASNSSIRRGSRKKSKDSSRPAIGIVYVLEMTIGPIGKQQKVHKIGITARKRQGLLLRCSEIAASHFETYGYFPYIKPIRQLKTKYFFEVEKYLHTQFCTERCSIPSRFSGSSELFTCSIDKLLSKYDEVMKNPINYITPDKVKRKPTLDKPEALDIDDLVYG